MFMVKTVLRSLQGHVGGEQRRREAVTAAVPEAESEGGHRTRLGLLYSRLHVVESLYPIHPMECMVRWAA